MTIKRIDSFVGATFLRRPVSACRPAGTAPGELGPSWGKDAFDKEIENDAFVGSPAITITRMTEENDVVIAEGTVRCARKDGGLLNAVFCDVFAMQRAKIRQLTTYQAEIEDRADNGT